MQFIEPLWVFAALFIVFKYFFIRIHTFKNYDWKKISKKPAKKIISKFRSRTIFAKQIPQATNNCKMAPKPKHFTFSNTHIKESCRKFDPKVTFKPDSSYYEDTPVIVLPFLKCSWCAKCSPSVKQSPLYSAIPLKLLCSSCFLFVERTQMLKEINTMEQEDVNRANRNQPKVWGFIHPAILQRNLKPHQLKYTPSKYYSKHTATTCLIKAK